MTKVIYLAWQDQNNRSWHIIGQLLRNNNGYEFRYTKGVKNIPHFSALPNMIDQEKVYCSQELFSLFKNRLMPKSRPDYSAYMSWMSDTEKKLIDEMDTLAISGGEKETDFFRIIPVPQKNAKGNFAFKFFVNGLSHMTEDAKKRVQELKEGDFLYMGHDFQNKEDKLALFLRTEDPPCFIGYIPAYFASAIHNLKNEAINEPNPFQVDVLKINKDAPIQMRLLCEFSSPFLNQPWEAYESEFEVLLTN